MDRRKAERNRVEVRRSGYLPADSSRWIHRTVHRNESKTEQAYGESEEMADSS